MTFTDGLVTLLALALAGFAGRPRQSLRVAFRTEADRRGDMSTTRCRGLGDSEGFDATGIGEDVVRLFLTKGRFLTGPRVECHVSFVLSADFFHENFLALPRFIEDVVAKPRPQVPRETKRERDRERTQDEHVHGEANPQQKTNRVLEQGKDVAFP